MDNETKARMVRNICGKRGLLDAKVSEFNNCCEMDLPKQAEECRETIHSLLDSWLDSYSEFVKVHNQAS